MKDEIYEKLSNIEDLNDRLILKKVLGNLFTSLQEYSEKRYDVLEKRVFNEVRYSKGSYDVFCTIVKKQNLDPTSQFLYPILDEDMEEKVYDTSCIMKNILEKNKTIMFSVLLKCDYLIFRDIMSNKKIFKGLIETNKNKYEGYFILRKNTEYWNKIIQLYKNFIDNNIPWSTINNPYISKIADVVLIQCEEGISAEETITKITVDFGEYSEFVEYDIVPLWNIKRLSLKSNGFPMPCEDSVNYEHVISLQKEGIEHGYLVEYSSPNIEYVIRTQDSIIVSAPDEETKLWCIWKVISPKESKIEKYDYEIMSNAKSSSFIGRLTLTNGISIKTKAELTRIINSFQVSKHIQFQYVKLEDQCSTSDSNTYDMNYFIIDEIRENNIKKVLALYFKVVDISDYIAGDILSFLVSEIQLLYPEYKCEGRLI